MQEKNTKESSPEEDISDNDELLYNPNTLISNFHPTVYGVETVEPFIVRKPSHMRLIEPSGKKVGRLLSKKSLTRTSSLKKGGSFKSSSTILRAVQFADEPPMIRRKRDITHIKSLQKEYEKTKESNFKRKPNREAIKTRKSEGAKITDSHASGEVSPSLDRLHKSSWNQFDKKPLSLLFHSKKKLDTNTFGSLEKVDQDDTALPVDKKLITVVNDKAGHHHVQNSNSILRGQSLQRNTSLNGSAVSRLRLILKKHSVSKKSFEFISLYKQLKAQRKQPLIRMVRKARKRVNTLAIKCREMIITLSDPMEPYSFFRTIWNLFLLFFVFYEVVLIPMRASFNLEADDTFDQIEFVEVIFFFIDILLNFHTVMYADSVPITKAKDIAKAYLKSWFWIDLAAAFPLQTVLHSVDYDGLETLWALLNLVKVTKVLRLIKFFKLRKQLITLKSFFRLSMDLNVSVEINGVIRLMKVCFTIFILAHWMACFWHLVAVNQGEKGWISRAGLEDSEWADRYLAALYWAFTTMLTVGYGDIYANSNAERAYNIGSMLVGCGIFGYTMNQIGDIINQINAEVNYKDMRMDQLSKFLTKNEVDGNFQKKIKEYMEFKLDHERTLRETDQVILDSISGSLKTELLRQINGKVLKNNILFQKAFGSHFLLSLSMSLNEKVLAPDEFIFRENETEPISMYFIIRGKVAIYLDKYGAPLKYLEKGDHIGEISFFTERPRESTARTTTFCSLFYITKEKFLQLVENHQTDKEMYHMVKDKINLYNDHKPIGATCLICTSPTHLHQSCFMLHVMGKKDDIIRKYKLERRNFEDSFLRKTIRRFNTLSDLKEIRLRAKQYMMTESLKSVPISHTDIGSQPIQSFKDRKFNLKQNTLNLPSGPRTFTPNISKPIETSSFEGTYDELLESEYQHQHQQQQPQERVRRTRSKAKSDARGLRSEINKASTTLLALFGGDLALRDRYRKLLLEHQGLDDDTFNSDFLFEEIVFDQVKNFQLYFPHNNFTKVLEQMDYTQKHKKYYGMKLDSDHDIIQFKKKLGKIFAHSKEMSIAANATIQNRKRSMFARNPNSAKDLLGPISSRSKTLR